ncbi:MAG: YolD-like family protein [Bacilli bacterium]|nr:YolD-like family protein [Bacilli bacterium]
MNDSDRGMMKYAPYKSLVEQSTILAKMRYEKGKRPRPLISADRAREINDVLVGYGGEEVEAEYYEDGYRHRIEGVIETISSTLRFLIIEGKQIAFGDLLTLVSSKLAPVDCWSC